MTGLLKKAIAEISKLPKQQQDMVAAWILEKLTSPDLKTEAEWDEDMLEAVLEGVLKPDGGLDFDTLRARGETISLSKFYVESDQGIES